MAMGVAYAKELTRRQMTSMSKQNRDVELYERVLRAVDAMRSGVIASYTPERGTLLTSLERRSLLALLHDLEGLLAGFPDGEAANG